MSRSRQGEHGLLLVLALSGIGPATLSSPAADLSTVNRDKLGGFFKAIETPGRPATVISFGDSMADSYRSPTFHLFNRLAANFGIAGYSLSNYRNTSLSRYSGGAFLKPPGEFWFAEHHEVPAGGAVWWDHYTEPGGIDSDRVGIFYVAQPEGGQFRLSVSTDGGPWAPRSILDGFADSPEGRFAGLNLDLNRHRIRVDSETGRNIIVGPLALNSRSGGLHAVFMDWPGIHLGQVTAVSPAIRDPIFAALQPDLIVWHLKEDAPGRIAERMQENESWWHRAVPDCNVLYIGTPWVGADAVSDLTRTQNAIVRSIALENGRAYADLMQPTQSYDWLVDQGFMADETHLNSAGGNHTANILWNDMGFFAVGKQKSLSASRINGELQLAYPTSANLVYRLEKSGDLKEWSPILTNELGSLNFSTNVTVGGAAVYYRLGLSPAD